MRVREEERRWDEKRWNRTDGIGQMERAGNEVKEREEMGREGDRKGRIRDDRGREVGGKRRTRE